VGAIGVGEKKRTTTQWTRWGRSGFKSWTAKRAQCPCWEKGENISRTGQRGSEDRKAPILVFENKGTGEDDIPAEGKDRTVGNACGHGGPGEEKGKTIAKEKLGDLLTPTGVQVSKNPGEKKTPQKLKKNKRLARQFLGFAGEKMYEKKRGKEGGGG